MRPIELSTIKGIWATSRSPAMHRAFSQIAISLKNSGSLFIQPETERNMNTCMKEPCTDPYARFCERTASLLSQGASYSMAALQKQAGGLLLEGCESIDSPPEESA